MKFKEQLRKLLKDHDMTAAQLSRKTGVPRSVISDWLAGASPKNIDHVKKVSESLGVCIEVMFFGGCREECKHTDKKIDHEKLADSEWISGIYEIKMRKLKKKNGE
jgi:transcriptional regulator with XRE-family HTH domain